MEVGEKLLYTRFVARAYEQSSMHHGTAGPRNGNLS